MQKLTITAAVCKRPSYNQVTKKIKNRMYLDYLRQLRMEKYGIILMLFFHMKMTYLHICKFY